MNAPPITLRADQEEAVSAALGAIADGMSRPLIVSPTGSGKSVMLASIASRLAAQTKRVLALAYRGELIHQNAGALTRLDPLASLGICHAGSRRNELHAQVVIASTATVYRRLQRMTRFDAVILDEAHLLNPKDDGMLGRIMARLTELAGGEQPPLIGLTATPFRMDAGSLVESGLFDAVVFERGIADMIAEGLLAPIVTKVPSAGRIETRGIRITAGDYNAAALERAAMAGDLTEQAVQRTVAVGRAEGRRSWLLFGAGVDHAHRIEKALAWHGVTAATITGDTPAEVRAETIRRFRAGELQALVNCNVLTTGFDAPATDLIAVLRPTVSGVLWIQMVGRGTRTAPGKVNLRLLDFGGNLLRHGPVDNVRMRQDGVTEEKDRHDRLCLRCDEVIPKSARVCPACGLEVPQREAPMLETVESEEEAIVGDRREPPREMRVQRMNARVHFKPGSPPSLRLGFNLEDGTWVNEFLALEHSNLWARKRAAERWHQLAHNSHSPVPKTAEEALQRFQTDIAKPDMVIVEQRGAWPSVIDFSMPWNVRAA